jgi:hypothetical protein
LFSCHSCYLNNYKYKNNFQQTIIQPISRFFNFLNASAKKYESSDKYVVFQQDLSLFWCELN